MSDHRLETRRRRERPDEQAIVTDGGQPTVPDRADRAATEREHIGHYTHLDGVTRGTVLEYDGWQWAVVTVIDTDRDPTRVGFVLVDELGDDIWAYRLEPAWGCWEHYQAVAEFRDTGHEYWTDAAYLDADVWAVLGPTHPDERGAPA